MATIIRGRPDFGNPEFLWTTAKKHPEYVYGRRGMLIHKVARVRLRWWDTGRGGEYLVRRDSPAMLAETVCGQVFFLDNGRSKMCAIPAPEAVLCGRCHGEPATFGKLSKKNVTKNEAKLRLGCIASAE